MIWTTSQPTSEMPSSRLDEVFCTLRTMLSINEIYKNKRPPYNSILLIGLCLQTEADPGGARGHGPQSSDIFF